MTRDEVLRLELRQLRRKLVARSIYDEREGLDLVALRFGLNIDKATGDGPWTVWHPLRAESMFTSRDLTEAVIRAAAVMMDDELPAACDMSTRPN
jgi:hypothetical protein